MTNRYLFTFRPLGSYFFGGENTFGSQRKKQDYFVRSMKIPQNSTLLGTLRYIILKQNNLLIMSNVEETTDRKKTRSDYIGEASFCLPQPPNSFGKIKGLSPIFVKERNTDNYYTRCPRTMGYSISFKGKCSFSQVVHTNVMPIIKMVDSSKSFSWKDYYDNNPEEKWISPNGTIRKDSDIFEEVDRVGIECGKTARDNKGFFKETRYLIKDGFELALSVDVAEDFHFVEGAEIVTMGGERTMWIVNIQKTEVALDTLFNTDVIKSHLSGGSLALSDVYLTKEQIESSDFIWGSPLCLRYMLGGVNNLKDEIIQKSHLFHLLQKGSVIFTKESLANKNLTSVGLNVLIK